MSDDLHTSLRIQLDTLERAAPPEPALADIIDRCESDLARHRRRLVTGAACAIAAGVAVAVPVPFLLGGAPDSRVANEGPVSDSMLIETCRNGSQPAYWTDLVFASGTPRIAARSNAEAADSSTILVSANGDYWADCRNAENASSNLPGALSDEPGRTGMTVYENVESEYRPAYSAGGTCPQAQVDGCVGFSVDYTDRLPTTVSAVEFTTVDGETTVVDATDDGFVLFDYEGVVLPGYGDNEQEELHWITQMTYLGADGDPLAANRWAGQRLSPKRVDGLPALTDYPSLARLVQDVTAPREG